METVGLVASIVVISLFGVVVPVFVFTIGLFGFGGFRVEFGVGFGVEFGVCGIFVWLFLGGGEFGRELALVLGETLAFNFELLEVFVLSLVLRMGLCWEEGEGEFGRAEIGLVFWRVFFVLDVIVLLVEPLFAVPFLCLLFIFVVLVIFAVAVLLPLFLTLAGLGSFVFVVLIVLAEFIVFVAFVLLLSLRLMLLRKSDLGEVVVEVALLS